MGGESFDILFAGLLSSLAQLRLIGMAHAKTSSNLVNDHTYWVSIIDLGLVGDLAEERSRFTAGLRHLVVRLRDVEDRLIWSWDKNSEKVTAKRHDHIHHNCSCLVLVVWYLVLEFVVKD